MMQSPEPAREPRPRDDDGEYGCHEEGCEAAAAVATPRRIESTGYDPVETIVTFCARHYLGWEVLKDTRNPLSTAVQVHDDVSEEFEQEGWVDVRLKSRVLANLVLFDDPRGGDPPAADSPLGDIFDHAGDTGERLREKLETPVEEQLQEYGIGESEPPGNSSNLGDFE